MMSLRRAHNTIPTAFLVAAIFAACFGALDAAAQSPRYTVTDLGEFEPSGVNDVGQVAGRAIISGRLFAVVYDGTLRTINPPEGASAEAHAINNRGQVVGTVFICEIVNDNCVNGRSRAFIYRSGAFTVLGTLGGRDSFGFDIDAAGRAVGNSTTPGPAPDISGDAQAFFSAGRPLENISAKMGVGGSRAAAINSVGQITGLFRDGSRSGAFIYDTRDGTFSLFTLAGSPSDLNDLGPDRRRHGQPRRIGPRVLLRGRGRRGEGPRHALAISHLQQRFGHQQRRPDRWRLEPELEDARR